MLTSDALQERKAAFERALRADGMRMTHQRLEVIAELAASEAHPSVEDVFRAVRVRVPTIALDTVYRTLATLAEKGLIERVPLPGPARFDPDAGDHHHFVCTRCGRILDVEPDTLPAVSVPEGIPGVGKVVSARLELRGLCGQCTRGEGD